MKPKNMPTLIPYLFVTNAEKSIDFYTKAFGFNLISTSKDEGGTIQHAEMARGDAMIIFAQEGKFNSTNKSPVTLGVQPSMNLYIYCEDVDALYKQAIQNGAKSVVEPNNTFWGDRMCQVLDSDGYEWSFGTHIVDSNESGK